MGEEPKPSRRGGSLGYAIFRVAARLTGLRGAYGLLYFVCIHYLLFDREAVGLASAYVKRRFPKAGRIKRALIMYRLFISLGKQLIDRTACMSGSVEFDVNHVGLDEFLSLIDGADGGLILLVSHVGNWQVAMTRLVDVKRDVYVLMRPEENPGVIESLHINEGYGNVKILAVTPDHSTVIQIMDLLSKGNIVAIMGDRRYGADGCNVKFLGDEARFPYGAFSIAAGVRCPLVLLLSFKEGAYSYAADFTHVFHPRYEKGREKKEQIREWVQAYARALEEKLEKYPLQWFMFRDLWKDAAISRDAERPST